MDNVTSMIVTGFFIIVALATIVVCCEIYLRRNVFDPNAYYLRRPGWEVVFRWSPEGTPGIVEDAHIRTNALGLRGEMPRVGANPKMLAIGGSTTVGMFLNDRDTWPGRAQAALRRAQPKAWVGNMGKSGTTVRHHILALEKTHGRLPKLDRIVALVGLNDMLVDFEIHHPSGLDAAWDYQMTFDYVPPQRSAWALAEAVKRIRRDASPVRVIEYGEVVAGYKKRRRAVRPEDFVHEMPDTTEALSCYRAALDHLLALARRCGADMTFITQPALWKPEMSNEERLRLYAGGLGSSDEWFVNPRNKWMSTDVLATLLDSYNTVTREVCASRGVHCIDLAREFPQLVENFSDDFHFSRAGARLAGEIIASHLL